MRKQYEQYFIQTAKALLIVLISCFAFVAKGQLTVTAPNNATQFVGEDTTYTFEATGYENGTNFVLFYSNAAIDLNDAGTTDLILGQSTVQDAEVDFDFTWPTNGTYNLRLHALEGDDFYNDVDSVIFALEETDQTGTDNDDGVFDRAGTRSLITDAVDLSGADTVTIFFDFEDVGADDIYSVDTVNFIKFYYSTNGGSTYTSLEEVGAASDTIAGDGSKVFQLPSSAYTSSVMFKIEQANSSSLGANVRSWAVTSDIELTLEQAYSSIDSDISIAYSVVNPQLNIDSVYVTGDDVDVSTAYPGDEINIVASITDGAELDLYSYGAIFTNGSDRFYLEGETFTNVNDTVFTIVGTVPTGVIYDGYDLYVAAYDSDDSQLLWSDSYTPDFGDSDDFDELTIENGELTVLDNIEFDGDGERSIEFPAFDFASIDNDSIKIYLGRSENLLSPAGTDLVLEYATEEGGSFTELTSVSLNALSATGTSLLAVAAADYPSGMITSGTILRIRQEGNNGDGLDMWYISSISINGVDNLIDIVGDDDINFDIDRPSITLDPISIESDNLSYPMTDQTFTFSIDEGEFPANTGAKLLINTVGDEELDILIGEIEDVTDESIDFKVPALEGGDYTVYLLVNDEMYSSVTLPIYEVEISISDVSFTMAVDVAGEQYAVPGSTATVTYSIDGEPGSGAQLVLSVLNNDGDYVQLNATETLDGTITGVLPQDLDYPDSPTNPTLKLSLTTGLFDAFAFSELLNVDLSAEELDEYFSMTVGTQEVSGTPDVFYGSSERSATSIPFDFTYGGNISVNIDNEDFDSDYDMTIYLSKDGETWEDFETLTNSGGGLTFDVDVPNNFWTDSLYFRVAYDDNFNAGVNTSKIDDVVIETPTFTETADVLYEFGLVEPYINLADVNSSYTIGQDVTVSYNAEYFPDDVEFAAVLVQGNVTYVIGTNADQGTQSISGSMPIVLPLDEDNALAAYEISVIPFIPGEDGEYYPSDQIIDVDSEGDFMTVTGVSNPSVFTSFDFDRVGTRELVAGPFDLSGADSVTLQFYYESVVTMASNTNTVPRLELSTDGSTWTAIEVLEDEDDMYQTGLLYNADGTISVGIPEAFLAEDVYIRWSQPLNLGLDKNAWLVSSIDLIYDQGNELASYLFNDNNQEQAVTIDEPAATDYVWMQTDLEDAVFNGETFEYTWDYNEDLLEPDTFPSGTQFTFILHDGSDFVIDPETDKPYVVGTTTTLGEGFEGSIPFYATAGTYDIYLIASIEVDGETYFIYGDEDGESTTDVGDLDVFLKAVRTTLEFAANDVLYAGSTATFSVDLENDETATIGVDDLYANLLAVNISGSNDMILATQVGTADITVDLPPFLSGSQTFVIEFTEGAPLGEVGDVDMFQFSEMSNNEDDITSDPSNFLAGDVNDVAITTKVFREDELYSPNSPYIRFDVDFDKVGSNNVVFQYSMNGGDWTNITSFGDGYYNNYLYYFTSLALFDEDRVETVQFRWVIGNDAELDGSSLDLYDVYIYTGSAGYSNSQNNTSFFPEGASLSGSNMVEFENDFGRGLITTRDFEADELENKTIMSFDLTFDEVSENLLDNQYLIFEYSLDAGGTYMQLDTFPEMDSEFTINDSTVQYTLTEEMKSGVRFRFRQEERNGIDVSVDNFVFKSGNTLPFDYITTESRSIAKQEVLITSVSADEICQGDEVTLGYEIRGRFGADNVLKANYKAVGGASSSLTGYDFMATEGTGTLTVQLPGNVLTSSQSNTWYRFSLDADDNTDMYDDINEDVDVTGQFSEQNVELVAPINTSATFSVTSGDIKECDNEEVVLNINSPQDYFMYEIINVEADTVMATLTYDPEDGETEITLGTFMEPLELDMRVTSMSSSGMVCNTRETVDTDPVEVDYLETFKLFVDSDLVEEDNNSITICEGQDDDIYLRLERFEDDFSYAPTSVEWFRDNLNNFVSNASVLDGDDEDLEAGMYFARVTDGTCIYLTDTFTIEEIATPEMPEITADGALSECSDGEGEVTLTATEGFAYYAWYDNGSLLVEGTSNTYVADEPGEYTVVVSNQSLGLNGCNAESETFDLEVIDVIELELYADGGYINGGEVINGCEDVTIYFRDGFAGGNVTPGTGALYTVYKDGVAYKTTTGSSMNIEESGEYFAEWTNDALNGQCVVTTDTFTVNITDPVEETPVVTVVSGDLLACSDAIEVTLSAPDGFAYYEWNAPSASNLDGVGSQTITTTIAGTYEVRVSNAPIGSGCSSEWSDPIVVREVDLPLFRVSNNTTFYSNGPIVAGDVIHACDDYTVYFYEGTSNTNNVNTGVVNIYLDGALFASTESDNYTFTQGGDFSFEWVSDDSRVTCSTTIEAFTLTISDVPDVAPVITSDGALTFCQGEGSVTLTAPEGFTYYDWRWNNNSITQAGTTSSNVIEVTAPGDYTVYVGESFEDGSVCLSPESNEITLNSLALPSVPGFSQYSAGCGEAGVTFSLSGSPYFRYQLVDAKTGLPSGAMVAGANGTTYVTSDPITSETEFMLSVSRADGSGCVAMSTYTQTARPNNASLELDGITLTLLYNSADDLEIRWYRNGVEMRNKRDQTSIVVLDAAEYMVEVDYEGGCTATTNTVDLTGSRVAPPTSAQGIVASTYPNPTTDVVNLDIPGDKLGTVKVQIMTLSGQILISESFEKNAEQFVKEISISKLDAGIYNMTVVQGNEVENIRIVKQ